MALIDYWLARGLVKGVAEGILVQHQRLAPPGGCACGWEALGESFARHVAEELDKAGVLREAAA